MKVLTHKEIDWLALQAANAVRDVIGNGWKVYAIPRGGVPAAYAIGQYVNFELVETPEEADLFIDDIIDSGATASRYNQKYDRPVVALIDKQLSQPKYRNQWIVFPWENAEKSTGIEDNIVRLLQYIGEDPSRGGLLETPHRVAKAWKDWTNGYNVDIPCLLKTFEDGAESCDQMVIVKDIPFYTHCEHHMAPFFGNATVAYIPNGRIVGLSKLSRVVDAFARRLQVQERLTNQIADALDENLEPLGVGVLIKARHLCMESRGICQQGHHTITSALRGVMRDSADARSEFMTLAS